MMTSQGRPISGAGVRAEKESFEFMPAVSVSSPSLGENMC
jgi:hypothetical protein